MKGPATAHRKLGSMSVIEKFNEEVQHQGGTITDAPRDCSVDEEQAVLFRQFSTASLDWHREITKRLTKKVDLHLLPMLMLMYMLNFLDRR